MARVDVNKSNDNTIKANLIKEALKIVDELAKNDLDEIVSDKFTSDDFNYTKLQSLIKRAKRLKENKLWRLT